MRSRGLYRTRPGIGGNPSSRYSKGVGYADARFILHLGFRGKCSTLPPFGKIPELWLEDPLDATDVFRQ